MFYLEVFVGDTHSTIIELEKELSIGRNADFSLSTEHPSREIALELGTISRKHVTFVRDKEDWLVIDGDNRGTRSRNGIEVNLECRLSKKLVDKDRIFLTRHIYIIFHDSSIKQLVNVLKESPTFAGVYV